MSEPIPQIGDRVTLLNDDTNNILMWWYIGDARFPGELKAIVMSQTCVTYSIYAHEMRVMQVGDYENAAILRQRHDFYTLVEL